MQLDAEGVHALLQCSAGAHVLLLGAGALCTRGEVASLSHLAKVLISAML